MTGSPFFFTSSLGSGLVIPNLVAHWKFDDGSGTSVADATGGGRTGTTSGTPTWGTGWSGGCLVFDGTDDFVSVADHASLNFGSSQDFTISVRINTTAAAPTDSWPTVISKQATGDQYMLMLSSSAETDAWFFQVRISTVNYTVASDTSVRNGAWHHLVVQRESTTLRAFHNNVAKETLTNAGISGSVSNAEGLYFGKLNIGGYEYWYNGNIDDLRIYNRALTTTEIAALYNGTVA